LENILITGYRAHELGIYNNKHQGIPYIRKAIANRLVPLLEEGLQWVITPGQYGVDLWAIEAAIELKSQYPYLKCSILTAYQNPEEQWNDDKKAYFQEVMKGVDFLCAGQQESLPGAMAVHGQRRFAAPKNRWHSARV
jgi:uncharacterized phage-like protein YoqJ